MKKILTIQDISCFGKCSLTVALPLLSSMGIETVILPTAVPSLTIGNRKGSHSTQFIPDIWVLKRKSIQ